MHVIRLWGYQHTVWPIVPASRWTWFLNPSENTVRLVQHVDRTHVYYNNTLVSKHAGNLTPQMLWPQMTETLFAYGVICTPVGEHDEAFPLPELSHE